MPKPGGHKEAMNAQVETQGKVHHSGPDRLEGGGLGTLGAAEEPLPETRSSWEALEVSSPNSTPTPPQGPRGCTEWGRRDVGSQWVQSSARTTRLPLACMWALPSGAWAVWWPPAPASHTDLGPQHVTVRPTGGLCAAGWRTCVCSPTPALYTPQQALERWEGPQVGRRGATLYRPKRSAETKPSVPAGQLEALLPASTARCPWERKPTTPQAQEDLHVSAGPKPICPGTTSPAPG